MGKSLRIPENLQSAAARGLLELSSVFGSGRILAKKLNLSAPYVSELILGDKKIQTSHVQRAAELHGLGGANEFLAWGQRLLAQDALLNRTASSEENSISSDFSAYDLIPKKAVRLSAGNGAFVDDELTEGYYAFHRKWLKKKGGTVGKYLLDIVGDSMTPIMRPGDWVMVDTHLRSVIDGEVYAVNLGDIAVVKRASRLSESRLQLSSFNESYEPQVIEVVEGLPSPILGKVVWLCREM